MTTRATRGKDGKFTGSVGSGKTAVPTVSEVGSARPVGGSNGATTGTAMPDYAAMARLVASKAGDLPEVRVSDDISNRGTGYFDETMADYDTLHRAFGEPRDGDGAKVSTEWVMEIKDPDTGDTMRATVYDWKNFAWDEDDEIPVRPVGDYPWQIGGDDQRVVPLVKRIIDAHRR